MTPSHNVSGRAPLIEWGIATARLPGESESGDLHLVEPVKHGVLVAAVDGIGHGTEAAAAARIAVSTLREHAGEGISALLRLCHQKLKGTRGAVMSLVSLDGERNEMKWLGVGNVAGLLVRARKTAGWTKQAIFLKGGIVGSNLPPVQPLVLAIRPGDTLALATDGISADFAGEVDAETSPAELAVRLCAKYGTGRDEAIILVVRYLGWGT